MRGTQSDGGLQRKRFVIFLIERAFLRDGGEDENRFQPCEVFADAAARAEAEGEIGESGTVGAGGMFPPLRIEAERIRPETWIAVHDPLAHEHDCAGLEFVTAGAPGR